MRLTTHPYGSLNCSGFSPDKSFARRSLPPLKQQQLTSLSSFIYKWSLGLTDIFPPSRNACWQGHKGSNNARLTFQPRSPPYRQEKTPTRCFKMPSQEESALRVWTHQRLPAHPAWEKCIFPCSSPHAAKLMSKNHQWPPLGCTECLILWTQKQNVTIIFLKRHRFGGKRAGITAKL